MVERKRRTWGWLAMLLGAVLSAAAADGISAIEVWTPDTGQVELEALPRDTPELRRQHALALIGAGQWAGGVAELRELIQAEPKAEWVDRARLAIARALIIGDRYRDAFHELDGLGAAKDLRVRAEARPLQFVTARRAISYDVHTGMELYRALIDLAGTPEGESETQKKLADALFEAKFYLEAELEYWEIIDLYPQTEWVPYCYYRAAECQLAIAEWLDLGLEPVVKAEQAFADFIDAFPAHSYTAEAREKLAVARGKEAGVYADVARFYISAEKRPWAAVNYLEHIRLEFPGTPEATWAEEELARIQQESPAPLRGRTRELELPGVSTAQPLE